MVHAASVRLHTCFYIYVLIITIVMIIRIILHIYNNNNNNNDNKNNITYKCNSACIIILSLYAAIIDTTIYKQNTLYSLGV